MAGPGQSPHPGPCDPLTPLQEWLRSIEVGALEPSQLAALVEAAASMLEQLAPLSNRVWVRALFRTAAAALREIEPVPRASRP